MLINYSISGTIKANNNPVIATYNIKNLTNDFVSSNHTSELGYYNINLSNYPDKVFNNGDIIAITFNTVHYGITYTSVMYNIIDSKKDTFNLNTSLERTWDYTSEIKLDIDKGSVNVTFVTTYYENILFKLYYKYRNVYSEIDSVLLSNQVIDINFQHNGDFKIVGYVVKDGKLLTYSEKEFVIDTVDNDGVVTVEQQQMYIEWE